jgi:eukaryotic-like serine/threonine-protein kinase
MNAPMDSARFARIEELFQSAVELPAADRDAFLLASEDDPALRAGVARLLAKHDGSQTALRVALDAATTAPPPTAQQIGPYRVLRELGVGGMGTVLLAERMFGDTAQKVALKLIRGFPTAQARERLARERSLLAELNHPNIAGLLDAGETQDNVPYLAMEYVEGSPLHAYCQRQALELHARLRLFVQLCRAVQHAHQRLIVHRDIKPGNILVRDDGTPVLLDFGIGKLLDATDREATATRVFTPAYAAPEQIAGRGVTTATDIYGLGCVLHELLTGRSLSEIGVGERIPNPSTVTDDPAVARGLRGELDTLVGKAMHAEPERRYASAQALADDVENFLSGRPLRAAPDSIAYRARKFVARHRLAVVGAVLIVALAAVFVWRLNAERQRALAAEAHAEREAQSTRRSRDFLVSLFQQAAPSNALGRALTARELIDAGSAKLEDELKDEPDSAARVAMTIAEVYSALGDPKAAIASGEKALALAAGDSADRALLRADILLLLGGEYDDTERFDDARRADEEALALRAHFAPDDHGRLATTLADLGQAATRRGDYPAGRAYFNRAVDELAKSGTVAAGDRTQIFRGLAEIDLQEGKLVESVRDAQASLDALGDLPASSPDRIESWRMLARAQIAAGQADAGLKVLEHALDVARASLGDDNFKVANIENDIAVALNSVGRYRDAIGHLEKSIAISEKMRPGEHVAAAFDRVNLGSIYESMGDYASAERLMREGIAAIEKETPDEPQLEFFRGNLARTLMLRGDIDGARAMLQGAMARIEAREGDKSLDYAFQMFRLARIELAAARLDAAERVLADAGRLLDPMLPPQHPLRVQLQVMRGRIAFGRGDTVVAGREFSAAEIAQTALNQSDPVDLAIIRMRVAGALLAEGEFAAARVKLDAATPVIEAAMLPQAVEAVEARALRADLDRREAAARR